MLTHTGPSRMPERYAHDAGRIVTAAALRNFGYGLLSVELALYWRNRGVTAPLIGLLFTLSLLSSGLLSALAGRLSARLGRRRSLQLLSAAMVVGGVAMALSTGWLVLLGVSMLGSFSPTGKDTTAILPLEQAGLAQLASAERRMTLYARYNMTAALAGALGALAAGAFPPAADGRLAIWLYAAVGTALLCLYRSLSPAIDERSDAGETPSGRLLRSRGVVLRLTTLFGVDALAGGLVAQGIAVLWLHERFGTSAGAAGLLFFGTNLAMAVSQLAAPWLARRFGLLRTMVFTHLPSNVLLLLVGLAPKFPLAATLLVLRSLLSQLDVPTRQAYTMALVPAEERGAAAGATAAVRPLAAAVAPTLTGMALGAGAWSVPFVLAGGLKSLYDLTLYGMFRRVPLAQDS